MGRHGRRYEQESKLNMKKVIAVIIAIAVFIMFVVAIKTLLTEDYTETKVEVTSYYPVYTNEKWGVIDQTGKIVIEPSYTEMITVPDSKTDLFICVYDVDYTNGTYKTKVIDKKNNEKFTNYDLVEAIENTDSSNVLWYEQGVLRVKKDNKYGLIDYSGNLILPIEYESIQALQGVENSIIIKKDEKVGLCDNKGNVIINAEYKEIKPIGNDYKNGYIVVNTDNQYGVIDFNNVTIFEPKYEEVKTITSNGIYIVKEDSKLQVVNKQGEVLLSDKFNDIKEINGENIVFVKNKKYGVINTKGEIKIEAQYEDLQYIFEEYYIAKKSGKYGIINLSNETKLPFEYASISYQEQARFIDASKENAEFGEIFNDKFEKKIDGIISSVNTDKSYLRVRVGNEYKYYNFQLEEKSVTQILADNTLFLSKKDGKYGYLDKDGKVVVDYIYEDATEQNAYGFASIKKDGKWGSINKDGQLVCENKYDLENNIIIDFIGKWHIAEDVNSYYYTDK